LRGQPANLAAHRATLISAVKSAQGLVAASGALSTPNPHVKRRLHPKHFRRIVELAFMSMVSSWEDFVEAVFVRYLAGAKAP
jgi:hypothetical protein